MADARAGLGGEDSVCRCCCWRSSWGWSSGIGQVGFAVTPEALAPQWNRLNPASGFKRLLSMRGSVEAFKGLLKMGLVGGICYATLRGAIEFGRSAADHADAAA